MTDTPASAQSRREADVVSRHLPEGFSADPDVVTKSTGNTSIPAPTQGHAPPESSLKLQGGDVHRDIFKVKARANLPQRAATFSHHPSPRLGPRHELPAPEQREPGGFRRQFLVRQHKRLNSMTTPVTKNFVSFLDLYGSFAGEDLADSDDDASAIEDEEEGPNEEPPTESRPLLGRRKSTKRTPRPGDASTTKTFFTLLKAFIGTGIMFLPKAFRNGGILFSSITLVTVSLVSSLCFHLLLQCRKQYGGGYGELGGAIGGPKLRSIILASITMSQLGFVCAGIIFTAENLFAFLDAVTHDSQMPLGPDALIALQLVVLVPLALIRNISKLGPAAMLADSFILIGLVYIWYYDVSSIVANGIAPSVTLFNGRDFTLTIGSAIFTFEGIGLILPIQSSMKDPEKFSKLLYIVMVIVTIIFASIGALCYATFGDQTRVEIISNFPQTSKLVNSVQFLYSMAVLIGTPVQLFPAVRIIEQAVFGERATGKRSTVTKWKKNALRAALTVLCVIISIFGANDLDKFVALMGSFACVPLVYIYPAFLHYKGVAESRWAKAGDILLMVVGLTAMVYTTCVTLVRWAQG